MVACVRKLAMLLLLVLGMSVLGCSHQEFNRPLSSWVTDWFDSGKPYLDPGKSPDELRQETIGQILAAMQAIPQRQSDEYLIGPGDRLEMRIFALESANSGTTLHCTVSQEGDILLPWVGKVAASGRSVPELTDSIKSAYADGFLKDPQISLAITEYRSVAITVAGAVGKPGVYYLSSNSATILDILGKAGGVRDSADELLITRTKHSSEGDTLLHVSLDLRELLESGNPLFNMELIDRDIVTAFSSAAREQVRVLGYVGEPGAVPAPQGRLDALKAVAMTGGLSPWARAKNSYVVRDTGYGRKPEMVRVDLTKIVRGVRPPLYLQAGDTLVVGSSVIARLAWLLRPNITSTTGAAMNP